MISGYFQLFSAVFLGANRQKWLFFKKTFWFMFLTLKHIQNEGSDIDLKIGPIFDLIQPTPRLRVFKKIRNKKLTAWPSCVIFFFFFFKLTGPIRCISWRPTWEGSWGTHGSCGELIEGDEALNTASVWKGKSRWLFANGIYFIPSEGICRFPIEYSIHHQGLSPLRVERNKNK